MNEDVLVPGFIIGGFRSFYGEPQYIGPLGRITAVVGQNNDGKSNVLLAAARFVPGLTSRGREQSWEDLDSPLFEDGSRREVRRVTGLAIRVPDGDVEAFLAEKFKNPRRQPGDQMSRELKSFADALVQANPQGSSDHLWIQRSLSGENRHVDDAFVQMLANSIQRNLANLATHALNGASGDGATNIQSLLDYLLASAVTPHAVLVPTVRAITSSEEIIGPELPNTSGEGFPQMLEAWQSPAAGRHTADRAKFDRINEFVRLVLDREDASIWVPFNSTTVHVSIADRVLPLENLGTGISQVILIAAIATWYDKTLICLEEPELHLHPVLLRRLVRYLGTKTSNQYLISTHSAHLMDDPLVTVLQTSWDPELGTTVAGAITPKDRATVAQHLGYRASDLLQANAVIWVEGPSDRIYLNHWIARSNASASSPADVLVEGIHYSIMFYGGRLLSHLTGEEMETLEAREKEFIHLLQINRNMAIMIDSDKKSAQSTINATKTRVIEEFTDAGHVWLTDGREIENYIPQDLLEAAISSVHPLTKDKWERPRTRYSFAFEGLSTVDKVKIAETVTDGQPVWDVLDLCSQVDALARFIRAANDL